MTLTFDNDEARKAFTAYWLDGGGDGGGNLDWQTVEWGKDWMRVKGTGDPIVWENGQMYLEDSEGNLRLANEEEKS